MSTIEFIQRFTEGKQPGRLRRPGVVVMEFGGGNCNKAGEGSCRDFCAVPNGKFYDPDLDPSLDMIADQFKTVAQLKPAIVSIVPNGEAVITYQKTNTPWSEIFKQQERGNLSKKQASTLLSYYSKKYDTDSVQPDQQISSAEKMAASIALGENAGLNLSLTTNGSFLNKELLKLYRDMGLDYMNLSYHPNKPFDPKSYDPTLEYLMDRASEAIEVGIIPTIMHVLTRQNADTFVALADYVTKNDIFFGVGIANARGGKFSTNNESVEPTSEQVKMVFRRLLARRLFADRHIRTTIPYLLLAPFIRNWVCDKSTDFFHISIEQAGNRLQPKVNVCSEVRSDKPVSLENFFNEDGLDAESYLRWKDEVMKNSEHGCKACTHQCYFESETRGTLSLGMGIDKWDWYTTAGKGVRQRYTSRHPLRPTVSRRKDFQKCYLWESLLQGIARIVAGLKDNPYWQETFKRSGIDFEFLLKDCVNDVTDPEIAGNLIEAESRDERIRMWNIDKDSAIKRSPAFSVSAEWHDANYLLSKLFRLVYLPFQKSGKEAEIAIPTLHFRGILKHESPTDFLREIEDIITGKRKQSILDSIKEGIGGICRMVKVFFKKIGSYHVWRGVIDRHPFFSLARPGLGASGSLNL